MNRKKEPVCVEKKEISVEGDQGRWWDKGSTYYMPGTVFGTWHSLSP